MKRTFAVVASACIVSIVGVAAAQTALPADDAARTAKSRAAVKALAEDLKARLVEALKTGGPVAGIAACNKAAQPATGDISKAQGLTIKRTALRVRNPLNVASPRERIVLQSFAEKVKAGADVATLEHTETVKEGDAETFVYMKAIPMAGDPCQACHGTEVKSEVKAEIGKLYPKDEATGFTPGELRGAFVVTQKIK